MYLYVEYVKVLAAYLALLYVWPSIVFYKYLRGKGLTFRFLFCSTVQVVLINGVILGLGLLHILNVWVVRGLFWGLPVITVLFSLRGCVRQTVWGEWRRNLQLGQNRGKMFLLHACKCVSVRTHSIFQNYKGRLVEYLLLLAILIFGMAYFSIGTFCDYSYGNYDQYTHFQWILKLKQGQIFPNGIYPEAMHCFVYGMRYLFGVKLHSCMLFLAGIQIVTFLTAAYCMLKEVFQYRYMPLFILVVWLTYDSGISGDVLDKMYLSMTRLTWTLPQEFGLYLVFLCPLLLIRFFKTRRDDLVIKLWYKNENLLLLMAGVGAAVSTHFYVLTLAFFMCLAVAMVYCWKMLSVKRVVSLTMAVTSGMVIGALPMVIAFFTGIEMQVSLWWGINRFQGVSEDAVKLNAGENASLITNVFSEFFHKGYVAILGEYGALDLILASITAVVVLCGYCLYCRRGGSDIKRLPAGAAEGYLFIVFASVISVFLYAAPYIGFPEFVAVDRIFSILRMMVYSVPWVLLDLCLFFRKTKWRGKGAGRRAALVCILIYGIAYFADFHEYLFSVLKRYNVAVIVTDEIMDAYKDSSYVVVSMFDESGQIEETGCHMELFTFLQNIRQEEYNIPVEYIFLYVEKRPLVQGQIHHFEGPGWLASKSLLLANNAEWKSQCPDILHTEISREASYQEVDYNQNAWQSYLNKTIRTILCSKAYYWYESFEQEYPGETSVYYEDEDFVCYRIRQDVKHPLNLGQNSGQ